MTTVLKLATTLTPDLIEEIITLSAQDRATDDAVIQATAEHPNEGITLIDAVRAMQAAENLPNRGLRDLLCTLSRHQIIELTALMWLGRGDTPETWGKSVGEAFALLCNHARENSDSGDIPYLMEKPLKKYLEVALKLNADSIVPG